MYFMRNTILQKIDKIVSFASEKTRSSAAGKINCEHYTLIERECRLRNMEIKRGSQLYKTVAVDVGKDIGSAVILRLIIWLTLVKQACERLIVGHLPAAGMIPISK